MIKSKILLITKPIRNASIRNKIFLINIVILFISLSVFAYNAIRISNEALETKATRNAARELKLIDRSLQILIDDTENYARILSTDNRVQSMMEIKRLEAKKLKVIRSVQNLEIQDFLSASISNVVEPNTHIAAASIATTDNKFLDIGYADNKGLYKVFTPKMMEYVAFTKTPVWTGLFKIKFKYSGDYSNVFGVAKKIIDKDNGFFLGTSILYIKESEIASSYLSNINEKDEKFSIVDEHGRIISSQNKSDLYKNFDTKKFFGSKENTKILSEGSILSDVDGKRLLVTVNHFKKLNWSIISTIPIDEITIENKAITNLLIIINFICLIFAFIASYLLSYVISKPILELVEIMKGIKSGDMSLRAKFTTKDEIGLLGEGFNNLMDTINRLMQEIYNEQRLKHENEFKLLQSQIKPHFLYNTIETIISLIKIGIYDNAIKTAKSLAGFYRISLSNGNDIITIEQEIQLIENYLSIQKQRYVQYMDFSLNISKEVMGYSIPKLTLQPLVENSIYHGLKLKKEKGNLIITAYLQHETIKIEVFDNGVGMDFDKINELLNSSLEINKKSDFGVRNVDSRLKLLYGDNYGLSIESQKGEYTKVTVAIPLQSPRSDEP